MAINSIQIYPKNIFATFVSRSLETVLNMKELMMEIFHKLAPRDVANAECVNKCFHVVADETLWNTITANVNPKARNTDFGNTHRPNFKAMLNKAQTIKEIYVADDLVLLPKDIQATITMDFTSKLPTYTALEKLINYHEKSNILHFWKVLASVIQSPISADLLKKKPMEITEKEFSDWCEQNQDELSKVEVLELSHISMLPKEIKFLSNLKKLTLEDNQLTELPKEIGELSHLELLNLENNKLTKLPKEFSNLHELKYLNLGNNEFENVPKEICKLTQLKVLNLANNFLSELPDEIGHLVALKALGLRDNEFTHPPKQTGALVQLEMLDL